MRFDQNIGVCVGLTMKKSNLIAASAVSIIVCLIAFSNCATTPNDPSPVVATPPAQKKLSFPGGGTGGIFDPSITKDPATGKLWMSYSAVEASIAYPTQNKISPNTRLAYSIDNGENWTDIGGANVITDVDLRPLLLPPNNAGTWMNEVSSLVYDPGAVPTERWKLMWQTFMKINGAPRYEHSWIAIKMASTPENLLTAPATKLFTSYLYDTGNDSSGAATHPPIGTASSIQIDCKS